MVQYERVVILEGEKGARLVSSFRSGKGEDKLLGFPCKYLVHIDLRQKKGGKNEVRMKGKNWRKGGKKKDRKGIQEE